MAEELTEMRSLLIARDIACGLEFLHEPVTTGTAVRLPVAHRDIKSSNILLRKVSKLDSKVTDKLSKYLHIDSKAEAGHTVRNSKMINTFLSNLVILISF